jgi:hypothetical protein
MAKDNLGQHAVESLETKRFGHRKENYYKGLEEIKNLDYSFEELVHHFPSFVGHMTISRFIGLYELYKQTLGTAGHIADIGIHKGASFLWFAKLVQIFEGESLTQVHGFDWFEGMKPDEVTEKVDAGSYKESYDRFMKLVRAQDIENIALVHKMDVIKELKPFLDQYKHLQFKLVFLDAGMYNIVKTILPLLWQRLTLGGILVLDQYNHELSPGETMAVRELLPDREVKTLPNIWMPSAYIVK